jgi:membrane-associated phospholipid phosphatase
LAGRFRRRGHILGSAGDLLVPGSDRTFHPSPSETAGLWRDVPADERLSGEASGSFYSGHANGAFLSAVYFSYTYSLRHPDSGIKGWLWAGSLGAASVVGGLRIAAGKHYLSDVVVGAAAGSFFGWVFPYMHKRDRKAGMRLGMAIGGSTPYPVVAWEF